jgi:hypothetical protein
MMVNNILVGGIVYLPLWKIMEFVSWDYIISNIYGKIKHVPNHQPPTKIVRWWPDNKNPIPFKNKNSQENVFQPTNRWI